VKRLLLSVVLAAALPCVVAAAPRPHLEGWTEETQTLLAAAVLGESGWNRVTDHDALPWLLHRRWQQVGGSFEDLIRTYCKALSGKRRWLLELNQAGDAPASWPRNAASWERHRKLWFRIRDRIGAWARGRVPDPCPGAVHFGGPMDKPPSGVVPAVCAGSANRFWKIGG